MVVLVERHGGAGRHQAQQVGEETAVVIFLQVPVAELERIGQRDHEAAAEPLQVRDGEFLRAQQRDLACTQPERQRGRATRDRVHAVQERAVRVGAVARDEAGESVDLKRVVELRVSLLACVHEYSTVAHPARGGVRLVVRVWACRREDEQHRARLGHLERAGHLVRRMSHRRGIEQHRGGAVDGVAVRAVLGRVRLLLADEDGREDREADHSRRNPAADVSPHAAFSIATARKRAATAAACS